MGCAVQQEIVVDDMDAFFQLLESLLEFYAEESGATLPPQGSFADNIRHLAEHGRSGAVHHLLRIIGHPPPSSGSSMRQKTGRT